MAEQPMIPETDLDEKAFSDVQSVQEQEDLDNSKLHHDPLLQELAAYANRFDIKTVVTLNLGGSMVSGTIISTRAYLDKFAAEYRHHLSSIPEAGNPLSDLILSYKPEEPKEDDPIPSQRSQFINLENARTYAPGHADRPLRSSLWRGNIAEVKGFCLGAPPEDK